MDLTKAFAELSFIDISGRYDPKRAPGTIFKLRLDKVSDDERAALREHCLCGELFTAKADSSPYGFGLFENEQRENDSINDRETRDKIRIQDIVITYYRQNRILELSNDKLFSANKIKVPKRGITADLLRQYICAISIVYFNYITAMRIRKMTRRRDRMRARYERVKEKIAYAPGGAAAQDAEAHFTKLMKGES